MSGLIIGGFGFGAFIFGFISTAIANPANEHKIETKGDPDFGFFHHSVSDKVPSTLRQISLMWIPLAAIAILFVVRNGDFVKN